MLWILGVGKRYPLWGLLPVVRGGPEGSSIRPAVSFAFDRRFSALKKWEQDVQRQKKEGARATPLVSLCRAWRFCQPATQATRLCLPRTTFL